MINLQDSIETITLFDTGAYSNCIKEELIPSKCYKDTTDSLKSANGTKLRIMYKISNAEIKNHDFLSRQIST